MFVKTTHNAKAKLSKQKIINPFICVPIYLVCITLLFTKLISVITDYYNVGRTVRISKYYRINSKIYVCLLFKSLVFEISIQHIETITSILCNIICSLDKCMTEQCLNVSERVCTIDTLI